MEMDDREMLKKKGGKETEKASLRFLLYRNFYDIAKWNCLRETLKIVY